MKKRIASLITASTLLMSTTAGVLAAEPSEKVEISFKVGDSTLLINGTSTTVETPYVAGEGTTLVPVRVITEAFGAEVGWDNDTETVSLDYPGVNVKLQIGNKTATVNDHTETLLEAPVLSPNDVTMVPLRFISETFGATVSYDNATEAILVVKESVKTDGMVTGITEMSKVGDSAYGWSMNTPASLTMTDRTFGGLYTLFENETSTIEIEVSYLVEDEDIDTYFETLKSTLPSNASLIKADKNLKDLFGTQYIQIQAKTSEKFFERRVYFVNDKVIDVYARVELEAGNAEREKIEGYLDSFSSMGYNSTDTHNLAGINTNKTRTFTDEKYKVSMEVPQEFVEDTSIENPENVFDFCKFTNNEADEDCNIGFAIYSKSDMDAKTMVETDFVGNTEYYNPEYMTISEISEYTFGGYPAYRYSFFVDGEDVGLTDIFFEKGEYVYNISFHLPKDDTQTIPMVMNSLKFEELNPNEIGVLIRNFPDDSVLSTKKSSTFSLKVPGTWYTATSSSGMLLLNSKCYASLLITDVGKNELAEHEMSSYVKSWTKEMAKEENAELAKAIENKFINGINWHIASVKYKNDDGEMMYSSIYLGAASNRTILISHVEKEASFGVKTDKDIEAMLKTIEIID